MKLEFPLLGLLAARSMTGYDIARWTRVEGKFSGLDRHPSQIYRLLGRMETEGWISHVVDPRTTAPDAKVYTLSDAGFERLLRWVRSVYTPPRQFRDPEFTARLRVAAMLDLERACELVDEELAARRATVRKNRGRPRDEDHVRETARPEVDVEMLALYGDELNAYGESEIDRWIAWLEHLQIQFQRRLHRQGEPNTDQPVVPSPSNSRATGTGR